MSASSFVWLLHQPGVTGWVKRELAERRPDLRFAFARPGLTTFKVDDARAAEPVPSSFARAQGRSLGRATEVSEILAHADTLGAAPLVLHVFERDPDRPADERDPAIVVTRPRALEAELRAAAPGRFVDDVTARAGDRVLDVITAPSEAPADGSFVGWHTHDAFRGPLPGGVPHVAIPPEAPSRAWAKIEEAIRWSGLEPQPGHNAVEIGSAPGGATWALLERGVNVWGVDPGAMAPAVMTYRGAHGNRFVHLAQPAAEVDKKALPRPMHWLANDVNLAPMVALRYIERFVALAKGTLVGAFITLKINDDGIFEALPRLRARIEKLGAKRHRYTQLPSHRSEIVAILEW